MIYKLKRIWQPEIFQGHGKKKKFFEGWYYKLVDKDSKNIMAFIPGISIDKMNNSSHSFIQIIMGNTCESYYLKFSSDEFQYSKKDFEINIGDNYFSDNNITLNINSESISIKGELEFYGLTPWPVKPLSPGIMGWYAFVPKMECYHGVVSLNHNINGSLNINNRKVSFCGGKGYIEKDWGRSFPKAWVWMQSNHFKDDGISLTASIAKIPWLTGEFTGFIIGLLYKEKLYRFATYTGAKLDELLVTENSAKIVVSDKKYILEIEGNKTNVGQLYSPKYGAMEGRVEESLQSIVNIKLFEIVGEKKKLVLDDRGLNTGMEITNSNLLTRES